MNNDDTIDGLLRAEEMEETAAYLRRGRTFALHAREDLRQRWIEALRSWIADRTKRNDELMNDLGAEIRFRGETLPYDLVQAESELMRQEIRASDPEDFDTVREKIGEYLGKLDKPDA